MDDMGEMVKRFESTSQAAHDEILHLEGFMAGLGIVGNSCLGSWAKYWREIKEQKLYRHRINPATGERFTSLDAYCEFRGESVASINDAVRLIRRYGEGFANAIGSLGIRGRKIRLLNQAPPEYQDDLADAAELPAGERGDKLDEILDKINEQMAQSAKVEAENERLQRALDQKVSEIDKRKKSSVRLEDELREKDRKLREVQGFVLPDDTAAAQKEIGVREAGITKALREIGDIAIANAGDDLVCKRAVGAGDTVIEWIDELRERITAARNSYSKTHQEAS